MRIESVILVLGFLGGAVYLITHDCPWWGALVILIMLCLCDSLNGGNGGKD